MDAHVGRPAMTGERPGNRRAHHQRQSHTQTRGGDPSASANTCSGHGSMMLERLFGVKGSLEHMFASPPARC
jgi:hypothetical protein